MMVMMMMMMMMMTTTMMKSLLVQVVNENHRGVFMLNGVIIIIDSGMHTPH